MFVNKVLISITVYSLTCNFKEDMPDYSVGWTGEIISWSSWDTQKSGAEWVFLAVAEGEAMTAAGIMY